MNAPSDRKITGMRTRSAGRAMGRASLVQSIKIISLFSDPTSGTTPECLRMSDAAVLPSHATRMTGAPANPAIEFIDVEKHYGDKTVVNGLSFHVQPGECFGLLGPNGAGKTTTLKMLLGLTAPDAGTIRLVDEPIPSRARYARRRVGVGPQFGNRHPDSTVRANIFCISC